MYYHQETLALERLVNGLPVGGLLHHPRFNICEVLAMVEPPHEVVSWSHQSNERCLQSFMGDMDDVTVRAGGCLDPQIHFLDLLLGKSHPSHQHVLQLDSQLLSEGTQSKGGAERR